MILDLQVNGYRSLLKAHVALAPGLNVFVGANGSGKTNLISFFDFLSELVSRGVPSAFERAGGATHAFSIESMRNEEPTLEFSVRGRTVWSLAYRISSSSEPSLSYSQYEYDCTIKYNKALRVVFVSKETVTLLGEGLRPLRIDRETVVGGGDQAASRVVFSDTDSDLYRYFEQSISPKSSASVGEKLAARVSPDWPLISYLDHEHGIFSTVMASLLSLASINVRPEAARQSTSISDVSMLKDNGSGLVSVLYRLKRGQYYPLLTRRAHALMPRGDQKNVFKSIVNWLSEVNPDITDIEISPNNDDATLSAEILMMLDGQPRKYGFRKISDGTVKWLALVTALFAAPNYGAIEEPENFLDPRMQELFVALLRERLKEQGRVFVISTHSESLLNLCAPDELLVFRFGIDGTQARRPKNEGELRNSLKAGRFGLGHYYRVGAVDA